MSIELCPYCGEEPEQCGTAWLMCVTIGCPNRASVFTPEQWNRRFVCLDKNRDKVFTGDKVKYKLPSWKNKFIECYVAKLHPPFCGLTADNDFDFEDGSFFPSEIELIKEIE